CKIADLLQIEQIVLPFDGGLLSAYGMGMAQVERMLEQQVLQPLHEVASILPNQIKQLFEKGRQQLAKEGFAKEEIQLKKALLYLRFLGQDSTLEIENQEDIVTAFKTKYEHLFGHYPSAGIIELESIKVVVANAEKQKKIENLVVKRQSIQAHHLLITSFEQKQIPVYHWEKLPIGTWIEGEAIVLNATSTTFIEKDWALHLQAEGNAVLKRQKAAEQQSENQQATIELELFTNRFLSIAEEMGAQLQRTAFSVNIKERLDFSCAILNERAELLVNAPHIPVHLGSLGICARLILAKFPLQKGDVIITNHPKYGGSHLPDVTLLKGVFSTENQLIGYVINRAHHAEIGGKTPGSMPPDASNLEEEGVVILPTYLVKAGRLNWEMMEDLLKNARFPSRSVQENLADINAALASLKTGEEKLQQLVQQHSLGKVHRYMQLLQNSANQALQRAISTFSGQTLTARESLDDGHEIQVKIAFQDKNIHFDFTNTSAPHPHNLNANISIVYSAIIYVLRLLCEEELPLNEGLMQQVKVTLPKSFLHPKFEDDPSQCPAVVGGNTEVSQRLVDTLLKAFDLAACSQGTMNNFLFGNEQFGYYETICGGTGAGEGFDGRSAIHQHMTNTKITDPEELEYRYPVRLQQFAIRENSGGKGKWQGGNGTIRAVEFLEEVEMTLITQHRSMAPYGKHGGQDGQLGVQHLVRANGEKEELKGIDSKTCQTGDQVIIRTPGGGAWGSE
ncbi:MAG: hydantoinase B/oxoprolinase family protein, partial [Bacteroidota bacterium]